MGHRPESQAPTWWALLLGLSLAALPFVHFSSSTPHHIDVGTASDPHAGHMVAGDDASSGQRGQRAHRDHTPHHGGQLGMVGRLHVELVNKNESVEIHLSDARRRPIAPTRGMVTFDTGAQQTLSPSSNYLRAPLDKKATEVTIRVAPRANSEKLVEISFLLQ